jgi:hypothetical protein
VLIPEKVIQFDCYDSNGTVLLGTTDVELPKFESLSDTISGAGIAGEIESITPGFFKPQQVKLKWRTVTEAALLLLAPTVQALSMYGAVQVAGLGGWRAGNAVVAIRRRGHAQGLRPRQVGAGQAAWPTRWSWRSEDHRVAERQAHRRARQAEHDLQGQRHRLPAAGALGPGEGVMQILLSRPLPLDPLALLAAEEEALSKRLETVRAKKAEIEEERTKDPRPDETRKLILLDLDFDALTGKDIDFCVRQATQRKGELVRVLAIDHEFHVQVASKMCGVGVDALKSLAASDYVEVVTAVQGFLTHSI